MAIDFKSAANNSFQNVAAGVSSGIGSSIGGAIGGLMTKWLNPSAYKAAMREELTGAEREQNAFNARQAEIARQFDLDMFNRQVDLENSSFQRQVSDMQKAGVNPALMYGGTSASGAGTPAASSGAQASASVSPADVNALVQLQMVGAQIRNLNAQTSKIKSETKGQDIDNANKPEYWNRQLALIGASKDEAEANIANLLQQVRTGAADEALKRANERLTGVNVTQADLENAILAYQIGMTKIEAKYFEAMKELDLALKSAALNGKEEEIKNLRKTRALLQAQIITEGSKSKMFDEQATAAYEFGKMTHKKTTWIDAEELEKLLNLSRNTELVHHLARKYDAEADYTDLKPFLELLDTFSNFVGNVSK